MFRQVVLIGPAFIGSALKWLESGFQTLKGGDIFRIRISTEFSKHFNLRPFLLLRLSFWVTDANEVEFFFFEWST